MAAILPSRMEGELQYCTFGFSQGDLAQLLLLSVMGYAQERQHVG